MSAPRSCVVTAHRDRRSPRVIGLGPDLNGALLLVRQEDNNLRVNYYYTIKASWSNTMSRHKTLYDWPATYLHIIPLTKLARKLAH